MKKKIVFILLGEIKFDGRVQKEIKTLQKNGYKVELIVSKFENDDYKNYNYKIYNLNRKRKDNKNIYNLFTIFKFNFNAANLIRKINTNIIHCNDLNTLLGGVLGKIKGSQILVYDAHELYPESMNGLNKKIWQLVETLLIKFPDKFILPEINRLKYFRKKYKIKKPISLVENFPLKTKNLKKNYFETTFNIKVNNPKLLYLGLLSEERGIEEVMESVKKLDVTLFCIGNGKTNYLEQLQKKITKEKLGGKIYLFPAIPQTEVLDAINSSDIGFVFYKNTNINNYYCASNKLYEFMNCDTSVVTNNYPGIIKVTNETGIGETIDSIESKKINKALLKIMEKKRKESNKKYYWENQENEFLKTYKDEKI